MLKAQAVGGRERLVFKCPICGTLQTGVDLIAAGAGTSFDQVEKYLGFSCVGRWTQAGPHKKDRPPGRGCNWTLGGLLCIRDLDVETPDGKKHPHFMPATPQEAAAHWASQITDVEEEVACG